MRAEKYIQTLFPGLTRRQVLEALETGLVCGRGGERLKKGDALPEDPSVDSTRLVAWLERLRRGNPDLHCTVVYEDRSYWVVDKPAGVPGHPLALSETNTITHWAFAQDPLLAARWNAAQPILTPHRLDTGTSGLLIVAKTPEAYAQWRERFQKKQVHKHYHATCWGVPLQQHWVVDEPIGRGAGPTHRMQVGGKEARPARSEIWVLQQWKDRFLAKVACHTGVTHQVRVHLAHSGFPLLGDAAYDPHYPSRIEKPAYHLLRAVRLEWKNTVFEAPSPVSFNVK